MSDETELSQYEVITKWLLSQELIRTPFWVLMNAPNVEGTHVRHDGLGASKDTQILDHAEGLQELAWAKALSEL